jgi:acyl-CoA synthetase (AMP-forming)/AMP-acid ligase II
VTGEGGGPAIYRSPYPDPSIPDQSLPGYVLGPAGTFGDRPALIDGLSGEAISYRELTVRVEEAAAGLRALGVRDGTAVAMMGANQPDWAVAFYGVLTAGGAVAPINPALTVGEVVKQIGLSGAAVLIADQSAMPKAREAAEGTGCRLVRLERLGAAADDRGQHDPVEQSHAATQNLDGPTRWQATAVIAFSSGTTGQPKGVMLTHRNLVATLCQHEGLYHVDSDDVVLAALPFFHIYGLSIVLGYALRHGATVVTLSPFSPAAYLSLIAERRVTWLHVAPPILLMLASPGAEGADLSSVRHVLSGAAPLDESIVRRAAARLGCPIGQGYGMTEASPGVTWVPDDGSIDCPPGSVGVLVAGTEARIVDPATGSDTAGPGELWVRGPQVMSGYLGDRAATASTIVEDGWLRTGDIVRTDGYGKWWVVDRLKELIKYKGYQVAPAELEGVLLDHPAIEDAAVVGIPDAAAGEIPKAFVVISAPLDAADLLSWVAARVAPYKKIRAVEFVPAIPKSASGKILRRELRQMAREQATTTHLVP